MERDSAPVYRSLLEGKAGDNGFGFDTEELSGYLAENLDARRSHSKAQTRLEVPGRVSDTLLTHLSQALGIIAKRNFNRIASQGTLEISVRSEERRVGKECRSRWWQYHE